MYFTSNHDENSWYGTPTELFGEAADAFAVLTATFHGMPLIYSGQEAGLDKRLAFFDKDRIPWREHENARLYSALLHLKRSNRALWNGPHGGLLQRVLTTNNTDVFAFLREKETDRVFVALNLSGRSQHVTLSGASFVGAYRNVFTGESHTLDEGISLSLPSWGYLVYASSGTDTGVDAETPPDRSGLGQNHPNPFSSFTTISYTLAAPAHATLAIFDMLGREVRVLDAGERPAGAHEVTLSASSLPGGVYVYRLLAGSFVETKRLVVLP
jgi:hypothetical protein